MIPRVIAEAPVRHTSFLLQMKREFQQRVEFVLVAGQLPPLRSEETSQYWHGKYPHFWMTSLRLAEVAFHFLRAPVPAPQCYRPVIIGSPVVSLTYPVFLTVPPKYCPVYDNRHAGNIRVRFADRNAVDIKAAPAKRLGYSVQDTGFIFHQSD